MKWGTRFACLFVTDNWVSSITWIFKLINVHRILLVWERLVGSAFFELNFSLLLQGFVVRVLMPQEWAQSPKHFVFLKNLVRLINCESLKEIGEMACVTPARSSRGQTYRSSFQGTISYFSFRAQWLVNDIALLTFFMFFNSNSS